jgi:hypothetical protein
VSEGPNEIGIVVKFEDFQITKLALALSCAWFPADSRVMLLALLQVTLAPGAKLPANAKAVKHKTDTAVMSASASFFIIVPPLPWLNIQFTSFLQGAVSSASPPIFK